MAKKGGPLPLREFMQNGIEHTISQVDTKLRLAATAKEEMENHNRGRRMECGRDEYLDAVIEAGELAKKAKIEIRQINVFGAGGQFRRDEQGE